MALLTPEKAGVSSRSIAQYIDTLEQRGLSTHDILLAKGDDIFFEAYWAPFKADDVHRLYSVTKSIMALAIGFAIQDGLLSLSDPMEKHFAAELEGQKSPYIRKQTVRDMLMMSTTRSPQNWFKARHPDRVKLYFEDFEDENCRPSGTIFQYDSFGSFVLGALVERVTGKKMMDYLREKLFDKIGVSQSATCLQCPGGHSWADSACLLTPRDLYKVARFVMNGGSWNGEQILDRDYVTAATSKQIDNNVTGLDACDTQGYGYQIWRTYDNSFFFNGMGCQFAICVPDKDLILIYNADNQGKEAAKEAVIDGFFQLIARPTSTQALPEDEQAYAQLQAKVKTLKLAAARGETVSAWAQRVNGVTYVADKNPMGIEKFALIFTENGGVFSYTNAQGDKELPFGLCENAFGLFPQTGYSDLVGSQSAPGHQYKCAASAAWVEPHKLFLKVQIIDAYLGTLDITISFKEDDSAGVYMQKSAEDFLDEYAGFMAAHAAK